MTYTLVGADGRPYESPVPGTLGGHRRGRLYGRLDCPSALRAIAAGHYVRHRVFFADETTATSAGYRPCAVCLPEKYQAWNMTYSPLPRTPVPVSTGIACGAAELTALLGLLHAMRPRPVSVVIGTAADAVSRTNGTRLAEAWESHGVVLDTVTWPETAASWLRHARRFAGPAPDAWIVTATPAGWVGMGRRLAYSTGWSARRTVGIAALAHPTLITAGGAATFDGLRGTHTDGRTWEITRTLLIDT